MSTVAQLFTEMTEARNWAASLRAHALHKHIAVTKGKVKYSDEANPDWARALLKFPAYTIVQLCLVVRRDQGKKENT